MSMEIAPNQTIYINNLNEKIKCEELKRSLYAIFGQFGNIVEMMTFKTLRMRGQAFVVFDNVTSSANAMRAMQGFPFYDKPMRINFSKSDSDVISKKNGTFIPRPKRKQEEPTKKKKKQKTKEAVAKLNNGNARGAAVPLGQAQPVVVNPAQIPDQPPNKILFLTNLPPDSNETMLSVVFNQFAGFKEVRLVPGRSDIAFVEFDTDAEAGQAKHSLQGFRIMPDYPMKITFAKK